MDSVTDADIDRIFRRIEKKHDLRKIVSKEELYSKVENSVGNRNWNDSLNEAIWQKIEEKVDTDITLYRYKAQALKKTQTVGFIGAIRDATDKIISYVKKVSVIYKKNGSTQLVVRDRKGRFTKVNKKELREVFR